jgi:hypothetical protein
MLENGPSRHKLVAICHRPMLIRPLQHSVVILALVLGSPAWTRLRFALEVRVGGTHERLSNVVEAVGRVMRNLLVQLLSLVSQLKVLDKVRKAVELVEDAHHVCWTLLMAVDGSDVGFAEIVALAVGYLHVASCLGAQRDPVVESLEGGFVAGEHVLVDVVLVWFEDVCLEGNVRHWCWPSFSAERSWWAEEKTHDGQCHHAFHDHPENLHRAPPLLGPGKGMISVRRREERLMLLPVHFFRCWVHLEPRKEL